MDSISSTTNKQKIAKLPEQVNVSLLKTSSIMYNNSKKYSFLTYGLTNETLFVQSPIFEKIVEIQNYSEYTEYYFEVPKNKSGNAFLTLIHGIEQRLIQLAFENKKNWFDSKENVKFRTAIKSLEDDNDTKIIKLRFPYNVKTKRLHVESLDVINSIDNEIISIKDISEGNTRIIININAVWFTDDMFGLYLRPVYIEEIKQCEYQFQDQYNDSLFIDSEIVPQEKTINKNVNNLNNMISSFKEELEQNEYEIDENEFNNLKLHESNNSNPTNRINKKKINNLGRHMSSSHESNNSKSKHMNTYSFKPNNSSESLEDNNNELEVETSESELDLEFD